MMRFSKSFNMNSKRRGKKTKKNKMKIQKIHRQFVQDNIEKKELIVMINHTD